MKNRYRMFRRGSRFYVQDNETGKQSSLGTSDSREALRLLVARNDSYRAPELNLAIARTHLIAKDAQLAARTWDAVMDEMSTHGRESTKTRCQRAMKDEALVPLRNKPILETGASEFLAVLRQGTRSTNHYLRRMHNLALGLGWLLSPVLHAKHWPVIHSIPRRGITANEHQLITSSEINSERKLYYELLWETGGSQSDVVALGAENIDWKSRVLSYQRKKLELDSVPAQISIGPRLESLLKQFPSQGAFFPVWSKTRDKDRSAEFRRRCRVLKLEGISLHSYRYAWAERACSLGYPERYAMANLGHSSRAVHRYYSKAARVVCPPLETYEKPNEKPNKNLSSEAPTAA